jgi:SIR2-like protein
MPTKYLKLIPKPVLDDLILGRWLPIIGAGMSRNAAVPASKKIPLWNDLGRELAKDLDAFSPNNAIDAISAYQHEFGRAKLIERLTDLLLIREAQPGNAHREFCSIPFDIVCTTNFDFLLERQYDLIPRYVHPVIDEDQLAISFERPGTLLLKVHGDLRHPSRLVVTEADYDAFLINYPLLATYLSNQLITKTAVLIGYSLDDPDFRQLWQVVSNRLGHTRRAAYALAVGARPMDIARFERRGVKVINFPGSRENQGEILASVFKELREYIREKVISVSRVTEEQPLRELQLPRDSATRLCFFSLPLELLPFYRERVFPAVEDAGFIPVTAEDVISPGDNISAKIDALIDRSSVVVCDVASPGTRAEFEIALARLRVTTEQSKSPSAGGRRSFHLIVIATEQDNVPSDFSGVQIIIRSDIYRSNPESFIAQLINWLREMAPGFTDQRFGEPTRLLNAGEYRAAVIAAISLLEATLRERFGKEAGTEPSKMTLGRMIYMEQVRQAVNLNNIRNLEKWIMLRNSAVHSKAQVSRAQAEEVVHGVTRILQNL